MCQGLKKEIQTKGVIGNPIHFDTLGDMQEFVKMLVSIVTRKSIKLARGLNLLDHIVLESKIRCLNNNQGNWSKVGWHDSSIVQRSGTGRSPFSLVAISKLFKRVGLDPGENSSQSPPQIDNQCCYGCGDSLEGIFFQRCTCKSCGKCAHYGYNCPPKVLIISNPEPCHDQNVEEFLQTLSSFHLTCYSGDENSFAYDSTPNFVNDSPNVFNPPPQPPMYSYEFLGTMLNMVTIVHLKFRLSVIQNRVTIKTLISHKIFKVVNHNILVVKTVGDRMKLFNDIPKEIYSNPLFDEEIISIKIDPHHLNAESDLIESLLNQDSSIISFSKIDSLLDEFADELILLKSISPRIDEAECDPKEEIRFIKKLLYDNSSPRPLKEFISKNSDAVIESFYPYPIPVEDSDSLMEEMDLSLTPDDSMLPGIENDDYDSERDILILEELLSNDSISPPENESFHFDIPSSPRPPAKPPDDDEIKPNSGILTVIVVDDISEHYILMPRLLPTQPTLASNQDKSPHLLSYRGLKVFQPSSESPMMIYRGNIPILDVPFLYFYPP
uniref:Reverse transcriptase domain-containing protein n=1 Tax=Tanacetum cinerariifolium TaxID=118510 RepID=A0A6L2MGE5_TANCI|nr:hypothetical protein [Tanacetum cinerariifolium]